ATRKNCRRSPMLERTSFGLRILVWGWAACIVCCEARFAEAAVPRRGSSGQPLDGDAVSKSTQLPIDRDTRRMLQKAQEAIKDEQFGDAVEILNRIICGEKGSESEDFFYQPDEGNSDVFRSLKAEAQRIIANLPPKGLDAYEDAYGPEAKR